MYDSSFKQERRKKKKFTYSAAPCKILHLRWYVEGKRKQPVESAARKFLMWLVQSWRCD